MPLQVEYALTDLGCSAAFPLKQLRTWAEDNLDEGSPPRRSGRRVARPSSVTGPVGSSAGHQSLPLARLGYSVTLTNPSAAMLGKAEQRLAAEPDDVRRRVRLVRLPGEDATGEERFGAVLCHGVLMYLPRPEPRLSALCRCAASGGVVSVMALNSATLAVRPALKQRWAEALAAFDASGEVGVLAVQTRAYTVEDLSRLLEQDGIVPQAWYGVWLFSDWYELSADSADVPAVAAVELQASSRSVPAAEPRVPPRRAARCHRSSRNLTAALLGVPVEDPAGRAGSVSLVGPGVTA